MAQTKNTVSIRRLKQENAELRARLAQLEALLWAAQGASGASMPLHSKPLLPVINRFPGALVLYDPERRIEFANDCAVQIAGYSSERLIGRRDEELFPPSTTRAYLPFLQRAIATRTPQSDDIRVTFPSGTYSARVTYVPLLDEQDNIRLVLGIGQDISKQVSAERAVRELEERFSKAFHASPIASVISQLDDGTIVDANDVFVAFSGYTREELIGRSAYETGLWAHPEERARLVSDIRSGRPVRSMPVVERNKAGEERQLLLSAEKIEIGGVECLITLLEDETEHNRAEAQLQQSTEQFRALAEHTPDVVVRLDRDCRMTYVNRTASRLTGIPPENFVGKTFEEMRVPRRLIPLWTEKVRWVLEHGLPTMMEFEYPTIMGPQTFEAQLVPEFDANGQVTHVLTVSRDITERTRTHLDLERRVRERTAELEDERARLRQHISQLGFLSRTGLQLLKMMPDHDLLRFVGEQVRTLAGDAIVIVSSYDAAQNLTAVHGIFCSQEEQDRLHEIMGSDPVGMTFTVTPKYREMMLQGEMQRVPGGLYALSFDQLPLELCRALEQALDIQSIFAMPLSAGEDLLGTVAILSHAPEPPRTARVVEAFLNEAAIAVQRTRVMENLQGAMEKVRVLNQELERRATELEATNRELESFSYSVSHDLRTPLVHISGFVRLLLDQSAATLPAEVLKYLDLIDQSAVMMDGLIKGLLQFSRISRQELKKQNVDVKALVQQTIEELEPERQGRQVEIHIGELPDAQADPVLFKQVWVNLLSNALKFTRKREVARIEIDSFPRDGETVYRVKDNGVGFDREQADKLFGVFQRFHGEDEYEGTGVGLALVERIIRRHGGWICAEAEVDQGATFEFTTGNIAG